MKFMAGESQEIENNHWRKAEITLDSSDFLNLLVEFELVGVQVTTTQQFVIMELETQRLMAWEMLKRFYPDNQALAQRVKDLTFTRDEKILALKPQKPSADPTG